MNGNITLMAGKYCIAPLVEFEVRQSDEGTFLSLIDERVDVRYQVQLDPNGTIVDGSMRSIIDPTIGHIVPRKLEEFERVERVTSLLEINKLFRSTVEDPLRCLPAFAKFKFTLRYGHRARDSRQVWPIAGYQGDGGIYVLYRFPGTSRGEQLLWIVDETQVILGDDADANRLPKDEWLKLFHLAAGAKFQLNGHTWKKMTRPQIAEAVSGKVFAAVEKYSKEA